MAMPDLEAVRRVLRTRLLTLPDLPATIAWENRATAIPDPADLWLRETLLVGTEAKVATQAVQATGIWRVDVMYPQGEGTITAGDLARQIVELFEPGTSLVGQGVEISIDRAERSRGSLAVGDVWWMIPISIFWRVYEFTSV